MDVFDATEAQDSQFYTIGAFVPWHFTKPIEMKMQTGTFLHVPTSTVNPGWIEFKNDRIESDDIDHFCEIIGISQPDYTEYKLLFSELLPYIISIDEEENQAEERLLNTYQSVVHSYFESKKKKIIL